MNDVIEKIKEVYDMVEYLVNLIDEQTEFIKENTSNDKYVEVQIMRVKLVNLMKKINTDTRSINDNADFDALCEEYKETYHDLSFNFGKIRHEAVSNKAQELYANNKDLLVNNIKAKLDTVNVDEESKFIQLLSKHVAETGGILSDDKKIDILTHKIFNLLRVESIAVTCLYSFDDELFDALTTGINKKVDEILGKPVPQDRVKKTLKKSNDKGILKYPYAQNKIINDIIGFDMVKKDSMYKVVTDDILNTKSYTKNDLSLTFYLNSIKTLKFDPMVKKTFTMIIHELVENVPFGKIVNEDTASDYQNITISVKQFMKDRQLKDQLIALRQLKSSLDIIAGIYIKYEKFKDIKGNSKDGGFHIINEWEHVIRKGYMNIEVSKKFVEFIANSSYLTDFNKNLYGINDKQHPNCFNVGYELVINARRNMHKNARSNNNKHIIKVDTLLNVCRNINPKKFQERCYDRLVNSMDALKDIYFVIKDWEFCEKGRRPLTDEELKKLNNYADFKELYILYELEEHKEYIKIQ